MMTAKMINLVRAHKRLTVIIFLWLVFCGFFIIPNWHDGPEPLYFLVFSTGFVTLISAQLFWIGGILAFGRRFISGKSQRIWLAIILIVVYALFLAHNFGIADRLLGGDSTHLTMRRLVVDGVWSVWLVGSWVGFGLVMVFWAVHRMTRSATWVYHKARNVAPGQAAVSIPGAKASDPPSPARRRLLERTAVALSAAPFAAAGYGLLYGRFNVEVTRHRIRLARLPKAFEGFHIAQLSDIHISPFMPAGEIRRCVTLVNALKADLVVLTGDYLADDRQAQSEVVQALGGLRAPYGVFGCLGNHEIYTETEDSIARLFAAEGIRILRQERVPIQLRGEMLNLIGIDYQSLRFSTDHSGHDVDQYLAGNEKLVIPGVVNILLSHNPNTFDRAAELGIDLTLAGHTHGGEFEFIHRGVSLPRIETRYISGWFERPGGQLYVNRGIGTTGFPIRFGSRPEITVLELVRRI
jgi:predicted MPP superfamily phosphohydrolase